MSGTDYIGRTYVKPVVDFSTLSVKGSPIDFAKAKEAEFRATIAKEVREKVEMFTFEENIMITFVPLVMAEVAWYYALEVVDEVSRQRRESSKRLTRSIRQLREAYLKNMRVDLDEAHVKRVMDVSYDYINACTNEFEMLWLELNGELRREWSHLDDPDTRTDALICVIILDVLDRHNRRMDALIRERLGRVSPYSNKVNDALREGMMAFVRPAVVGYGGHVGTIMSIMERKLDVIRFSQDDFKR